MFHLAHFFRVFFQCLFIFDCPGPLLLQVGFSLFVTSGVTLGHGVQASFVATHGLLGLVGCGAQA